MDNIEWGPWDPEWGNKTAPHPLGWEYAIIPAHQKVGSCDVEWVFKEINDGAWLPANCRLTHSVDLIIRRRRDAS